MHLNRFLRLAASATLALASLAQAETGQYAMPGTTFTTFSGQGWVNNLSDPATLYTVPAGRTAKVTDVIVWGGDIAAGRTCSIVVYCSSDSGTNLVYFMADAGKSTHYPMNTGLSCPAGGKLTAYTYQNSVYTASTGCGNGGGGNNTPWLILRGVLVKK